MELILPKLIFIQPDGNEKSIDAENGLSIMEVARDNDLGIEGTCGGSISCCTCHVVIDKDWFPIVGKPNPDEEDMLDLEALQSCVLTLEELAAVRVFMRVEKVS